MFQLNKLEFANLKSQFATSSWGGRRKAPYAFTEHGVLMLSSVLKSPRAISVNIQIIRIFIKMLTMILNNKELLLKIERIEQQIMDHGDDIHSLLNI